jgi:predicted amidophosphoribosyltransferase
LLDRAVVLTDGSVLPVCAAGVYGGRLRGLLLAYKERHRSDLADLLAVLQARAVLGVLLRGSWRPDVPVRLVPVPSRGRSRRARGGDVGLDLARGAAGHLVAKGWPVRVGQDLRHRRAGADQAGLDRAERARNLHGSLVLRAGARPRSGLRGASTPGVRAGDGEVLVLVDDILTTGATLREATRAARAGGLPVLGGAVVGATGRVRRAPLSSPPTGV